MHIDWDLLHRYLADDCTEAERERFELWLAAAPMHRQVFHEIRELAVDVERAVPVDRQEALLVNLKRQVEGAPPLRLVPRMEPAQRSWVPRVVRVAAMLVGVVGASVFGYRFFRSPSSMLDNVPSVARTFTTPSAARLSLRLSDGTLVDLAPASTLRLAADYGKRKRAVELVGEAVFTVTHDASRPFAVRTRRLVAQDLGTRFAVRAYPGDSTEDVAVEEGIVAVVPGSTTTTHPSDRAVLEEGDHLRLTGHGPFAVQHDVALDSYFGWTEGRLVFRDARLDEAVVRLARWYAVDIRLAQPKLSELRFTASFDGADTTDDILRVIADALSLRVARDEHGYILRAE